MDATTTTAGRRRHQHHREFRATPTVARPPAARVITTPASSGISSDAVDPRMVFFQRAHARLILVEAGVLTLDEAYAGLIGSVMRPSS